MAVLYLGVCALPTGLPAAELRVDLRITAADGVVDILVPPELLADAPPDLRIDGIDFYRH